MRYATMVIGLLLVAVALSSGCSDDATPQQLDAAQQAVQKALDTWKQGAKAENLKSGSPPIEFHDDDWQQAARLLEYQLVQGRTKGSGPLSCPHIPRTSYVVAIRRTPPSTPLPKVVARSWVLRRVTRSVSRRGR